MHAASVNPEPGSNSLKNCIISHLSMRHNLFRVFSDYLLLLCWVFSKSAFSISQENINEILSHLHVLKNFLCCSIFKEQVPTESRLSKSACLLYQILSHLSSVFPKFFSIFFKMYIKIKKFSVQKRLLVQNATCFPTDIHAIIQKASQHLHIYKFTSRRKKLYWNTPILAIPFIFMQKLVLPLVLYVTTAVCKRRKPRVLFKQPTEI